MCFRLAASDTHMGTLAMAGNQNALFAHVASNGAGSNTCVSEVQGDRMITNKIHGNRKAAQQQQRGVRLTVHQWCLLAIAQLAKPYSALITPCYTRCKPEQGKL